MALETATRRRSRLSMTSLIDVIFLLLLFFMLTSTFTKYGEIELISASRGAPSGEDAEKLFLTLRPSGMMLNGTPVDVAALRERLEVPDGAPPRILLVSLAAETSSQQLVDILTLARGFAGLTPVVLR
ncbi:Biopolymer transport protein ExbD/TolR [Marinibacterium anthonyi]|nr:Biopolymer transport protein ExbD/TolR [Marinibacterium anthonyi]